MLKFFGKNPSKEKQAIYAKLPNYKNGKWQNPNNFVFSPGDIPFFKILREILKNKATTIPKNVIPSVPTDLKKLNSDKPVVVWFGHSSYFISYQGKNILVDPVFSGHASPFWFIRAFKGSNEYKVEAMPEIDILIITHDHYDHLDMETARRLKPKVKKVVTALGVGSHLAYWGYDEKNIKELNWFESVEINKEIKLTATPAQHMSSRGLGLSKTLWASFVLQLGTYKFFIGGDSGYGQHFKDIGNKFGPFNLAFLENGQFNKYWRIIHEFPEEAVQAASDLRVQILFPVHWAKFRLAYHAWNGPIKDLLQLADKQNQLVTVPKIGEPYVVGTQPARMVWWDFTE
jgi:L-ascorbate metabolism protein UlaG (beta-lactamase superfamily)